MRVCVCVDVFSRAVVGFIILSSFITAVGSQSGVPMQSLPCKSRKYNTSLLSNIQVYIHAPQCCSTDTAS